jgi:signal transduction histidine kinase
MAREPIPSAIANRQMVMRFLMAGCIVIVGALAYADALRESRASLADFADEQVLLARALAVAVGSTLDGQPQPSAAQTPRRAQALATLRALERPARLVLMVRPPDGTFQTTAGTTLRTEPLEDAVTRGEEHVRLSREQAAALGLPARTAMAGLAAMETGSGRWMIAAIATAERQRDRERWARTRLILTIGILCVVVTIFGAMVLRHQRAELVAQHELAMLRTRERQEERLSRAARAVTLGTLAMGIAHEVSTPLGVIMGRAEQLLTHRGGSRDDDAIRVIVQQCERISQIIRGLLRLARGDEPQLVQIRAADIVRSAVDLVAHKFASAQVEIQVDSSDHGSIMGDPGLLEHAIVNLLLNACEASATGSAVTVRIRSGDKSVVLAVEDEGHGISADDAYRATEPFFTTKRGEGGTGLGLAVAREIVAAHRGTLSLSPRSPHGTAATIDLPVAS